jgi:SAM-dependent methyltransferase
MVLAARSILTASKGDTVMNKMNTVASPAEMYQSFYGPGIFEPLAEHTVARAAPRPGEHVLDLACGSGIVARRVAALGGPSGKVTGLDLRQPMLDVASSQASPPDGAPITYLQGDATELPFGDEVFDLVICQQGLQFFPDRQRAVGHMHRVLRPGGRTTVACWLGLEHQGVFDAIGEVEKRHFAALGIDDEDYDMPFSLGDAGELGDLLAGTGFSDIEITEHAVTVRFPDPPRFIANCATAYAAVIPAFIEDRAAFERFVTGVEAETRDIVARHTAGDHVVFEMRTNIATAMRR